MLLVLFVVGPALVAELRGLRQAMNLRTYFLLPRGHSGQQLPIQPRNGPKSWLLFCCDASGGVWKCCSSFLLSGRRMVANSSV